MLVKRPDSRVRISTIQPMAPTILRPTEKPPDLVEIERYRKENLARILRLLDEAGEKGSDIVCTPEDSLVIGSLGMDPRIAFSEIAETIDGEAASAIARAARRHGMYVVAGMFIREEARLSNAAILFDRAGVTTGVYRKTHIPRGEHLEITPGDEYPVFDTDCGRVGIMICWDMNFPEVARILALNGARILFNPTWGFDFGGEANGEVRARSRALDNCVCVVTSMYASKTRDRPGRSCIVDIDGRIVADGGYEPDVVVTAELDPRRPRLLGQGSEYSGVPDLRRLLLWQRRPETYHSLTAVASMSLEASGYGPAEVDEEVRKSARTKEEVLQESLKARRGTNERSEGA